MLQRVLAAPRAPPAHRMPAAAAAQLRMETWESSLHAGGSVGSAARHDASHKVRTAPGCQPAGDAARRSQRPSESQKPALQPMQGTQLLKGFRVGVLTLPLVRRPLI